MSGGSYWYYGVLLFSFGYTWVVVNGQQNIQQMPLLLPIQDAEDDLSFNEVKGLYVKESTPQEGERNFGLGMGNAAFNTALNNFITNQQNFLEQLRPQPTAGTATGGLFGTAGNGLVTPIVVNLANGGVTGGVTGGNQNAAAAALLPGIIGQSVANGILTRRRPVNRRRRRRPNRRNPIQVIQG